MNLQGIVDSEVSLLSEGRAGYDIISGDERYLVRSEGRQAIKDAIFVRKGQYMDITGEADDHVIKPEISRIDIRSELNRHSKEE